ncbi:hypothetical protein [Candidatus Magnetobacterium casense]|uniref:Transposase n=1 Tax=Candidatus Magnetobacterium casense TaxID=1455061 RepID=A0ABS6RYC3_9BACT|nr:hypothetical protein [Candidatus Magnetobacterium casensis]MBV6341034.1 hypothetical protein [Candidatus Magnetobacterium casensis]
MNDRVYHEINVRMAGKIWHFRELFDIEGSEDTDRSIASDLFYRGIRTTHRIYRELKKIFHDELQDKTLSEEAEIIANEQEAV